MIEGLKFDMTGVEMREHMQGRIAHHQSRKVFYDQKVAELQAGGAEAMQYTGGDPVRALQDKSKEHQVQVELFTFLRDHLIVSETYRLEEDDLRKLEITSRRW